MIPQSEALQPFASDETRMRVPVENGGLKGRHGIGATFAYAA
jgi:hypothetical protein